MELAEQICQRIGLRLATKGGLRLIAAEDAEAFLDGCQTDHVRVLGVEGFIVDGDSTVPDMDAIADLSGAEGRYTAEESVADARRFVRVHRQKGLLFDFVLEGGDG